MHYYSDSLQRLMEKCWVEWNGVGEMGKAFSHSRFIKWKHNNWHLKYILSVTSVVLRPKIYPNRWWPELRPRPNLGSLQHSPDSLVGWEGASPLHRVQIPHPRRFRRFNSRAISAQRGMFWQRKFTTTPLLTCILISKMAHTCYTIVSSRRTRHTNSRLIPATIRSSVLHTHYWPVVSFVIWKWETPFTPSLYFQPPKWGAGGHYSASFTWIKIEGNKK